MEFGLLFITEERMKTYTNWPFSDKHKCNMFKMAEAEFYSVATGADDADAVKCFLYKKELDGWEADDDTWLEKFLSNVKQYTYNDIKRLAGCRKEKIDEKTRTIQRR